MKSRYSERKEKKIQLPFNEHSLKNGGTNKRFEVEQEMKILHLIQ